MGVMFTNLANELGHNLVGSRPSCFIAMGWILMTSPANFHWVHKNFSASRVWFLKDIRYIIVPTLIIIEYPSSQNWINIISWRFHTHTHIYIYITHTYIYIYITYVYIYISHTHSIYNTPIFQNHITINGIKSPFHTMWWATIRSAHDGAQAQARSARVRRLKAAPVHRGWGVRVAAGHGGSSPKRCWPNSSWSFGKTTN